MATLRESLLARHERGIDKVNVHLTRMYDQIFLSKDACLEMLEVLNTNLPGESNCISHWLRKALVEAIAVIDMEDGIAIMDNFRDGPVRDV